MRMRNDDLLRRIDDVTYGRLAWSALIIASSGDEVGMVFGSFAYRRDWLDV
jgi:hypothetical protein